MYDILTGVPIGPSLPFGPGLPSVPGIPGGPGNPTNTNKDIIILIWVQIDIILND